MSRRRGRGKARPTHEQVIQEFISSLIADGVSPAQAKTYADHVRDFHRESGLDFLNLTQEQIDGLRGMFERELEELDREEAEELARARPGEPER